MLKSVLKGQTLEGVLIDVINALHRDYSKWVAPALFYQENVLLNIVMEALCSAVETVVSVFCVLISLHLS